LPICDTETVPAPLLTLIFDLDGTLTDSMPGIVDCLRQVLDAHGIVGYGALERFVGPPTDVWTKELFPAASQQLRNNVADEYRACYDQRGWQNNSVYPQIPELLTRLREHHVRLYVCTSKRQAFAKRILDLFELSNYFCAVYGDQPQYPTRTKVDLLATLLREQNLSPQATWMVGDRIFDIEAAHANRMRCLAAGWGYGSLEECAHADAHAAYPAQVLELLITGAT
jgi:phosphoglycolate phosphatase